MSWLFFRWASPLMPDTDRIIAARYHGIQIGGFQFGWWSKSMTVCDAGDADCTTCRRVPTKTE